MAILSLGSHRVRDLRWHVELPTDAMPDVVAHDRTAAAFRVLLDGRADVADALAVFHFGDAELEAAARRLDDVDGFGARLTDVERHARVAVVAVFLRQVRRDVDVDDVTVLEFVAAWDTVADALVHARANALREALVVERRWGRVA